MVNQWETMDKKYIVTPKGFDNYTETPPKKCGKNNSNKTCSVTNTRRAGIQDDIVEIKLAISDEEYILTSDRFDSE